MQDVTERRQAEEALRQSEERYRSILESIRDGYYEIDLEGNFTLVNHAVCKHLGYTREELIGKNPNTYSDEATAKRIRHLYAEVYKTGKPITSLDLEYIKKDGTRIYRSFGISVSGIRRQTGRIPGHLSGCHRAQASRRRPCARVRRNTEPLLKTSRTAILRLTLLAILPSLMMRSAGVSDIPKMN